MDTDVEYALQQQNVRVFRMDSEEYKTVSYNRRDYYKIAFVTEGTGLMHFGDVPVVVDRPFLLYFNPLMNYSWTPTSETHSGYTCLFRKDFLNNFSQQSGLSHSPLFTIGSVPAFAPDETGQQELTMLFDKMIAEFKSGYAFKEDLLKNYIHLLLHESVKQTSVYETPHYNNAAERISRQFIALLLRQFPIDSPLDTLEYRAPIQYAEALNVHVNHLNQSVKAATGKTTIAHIQQKIVSEAKMLLLNTDWTVSQIAYCLGFEYPTYFNNFFKKHTGNTPLSFRK